MDLVFSVVLVIFVTWYFGPVAVQTVVRIYFEEKRRSLGVLVHESLGRKDS